MKKGEHVYARRKENGAGAHSRCPVSSASPSSWTRSERTTARWMCRNPSQLCSRLCTSWHGAPPPSLYLRALIVVRKGTGNKNQHERRGQKAIEKEERPDAAEEGVNARRVRHACLPSPHPPQEQPDASAHTRVHSTTRTHAHTRSQSWRSPHSDGDGGGSASAGQLMPPHHPSIGQEKEKRKRQQLPGGARPHADTHTHTWGYHTKCAWL
jgi:hypothetical protein